MLKTQKNPIPPFAQASFLKFATRPWHISKLATLPRAPYQPHAKNNQSDSTGTHLFISLSGNLTWRWNIPIYGIQKSCTNGWFSIARIHCWRVTIEHSRRIQAWNQSRVQHSSPMPFAGPHGCWKRTSCPCRLVEMGNGDDPRNGMYGNWQFGA